jgi:HlyD family secretion protein
VKILITILVTAAVVGAGAYGFIKWRTASGAMGPNAQDLIVRIEPVQRGSLIETVSAPGTIQPKTKVSISARVAARVIELPFKEGDIVTKGDPNANPPKPASILVKLDSKDLEAQLRAAEAHYAAQAGQLIVAQARIESEESSLIASKVMMADAERDLKRQNELLATKDVAQATVDAAQAKYDQLSAQVQSTQQAIIASKSNLSVLKHEMEAADAEIARARDSLSYTTITSPIDGLVTKLNSQVGELVVIGTMNNRGTVIMEVADLGTMICNARTDEASVASVKLGQKAQVRAQAYPDEVFEGTVSAVALAQTDERDNMGMGGGNSGGGNYYKTEILLDTKGRQMLAGLSADVDIETARHDNVLTIPSQAVLGRPVDELPLNLRDRPEVDKNKTLVTVMYKFVDGKSVVTPVKVGPSDVTHTIVESGLAEGDQVIVGPYKVLEKLTNDQKVKDEKTVPSTQPAKT